MESTRKIAQVVERPPEKPPGGPSPPPPGPGTDFFYFRALLWLSFNCL